MAVVWAAPRVEGFSLAPDFAAAASCVSGTDSATFNTTRYAKNCNTNNCCDACVNGTGRTTGRDQFGLFHGPGFGNTPREGTLCIAPTVAGADFDLHYPFPRTHGTGEA